MPEVSMVNMAVSDILCEQDGGTFYKSYIYGLVLGHVIGPRVISSVL
jgi:hypothetical protein